MMCSWTAMEVISHFKAGGAPVYSCCLDYRKAFDVINHVKMFQILIDRKVNLIFVRLMIIIYLMQRCYIRWQETRSYSFSVTNGTRQGSVFSPRGGFACYLDTLLVELKNSGQGCSIGQHWYGALALADDVILLATNLQSLQDMIRICEEHAKEYELTFSTDPDPSKSKTVCLAFNDKKWKDLPKMKLNGDELPWKEQHKHLGNKLHCSGNMEQDAREKRGRFVSNAMDLNQQYSFASTEVKLRMLRLYLTSFFGSNTWDFTSPIVKQFGNSWNRNIRVMFNLPLNSKCWIVEELSQGRHFRQMIFSRFIKFVNSLKTNRRPMVQSLCRIASADIRMITGRNLMTIGEETGVFVRVGVTSPQEIGDWRVYKPEVGEEWRFPLVVSLLEIRDKNWELKFNEEKETLEDQEIQTILNDISTGN